MTIAPAPQRAAAAAPVELSVVVPAHNESAALLGLIDEIASALGGGASYEIIVVDDCSSDDTATVLGVAARRHAQLRCLRHGARRGQTAAIWSGVRAARAPLVATFDGDGQNDPADIARLRAAWDDGAPDREPRLVAGQRRKRRDSLTKRVSSRIANGVRSRWLDDRTPDTGCGLKLFARDAFLALPAFDHAHRFLPALFLSAGGSVTLIDVTHRARRTGRTHYGVFDRLSVGVIDLLGVKWLQRRTLAQADAQELFVETPPETARDTPQEE